MAPQPPGSQSPIAPGQLPCAPADGQDCFKPSSTWAAGIGARPGRVRITPMRIRFGDAKRDGALSRGQGRSLVPDRVWPDRDLAQPTAESDQPLAKAVRSRVICSLTGFSPPSGNIGHDAAHRPLSSMPHQRLERSDRSTNRGNLRQFAPARDVAAGRRGATGHLGLFRRHPARASSRRMGARCRRSQEATCISRVVRRIDSAA